MYGNILKKIATWDSFIIRIFLHKIAINNQMKIEISNNFI